jgi:LmbE family N-acetylglucosaminyl deacetylase
MIFSPSDKILVLAPHADDAEFGVGGTLNKLAEQGNEIHQLVFSTAANYSQDGLFNQNAISELKAASTHLGIPKENYKVFHYPVRNFPQNRQEILDIIIHYYRKLGPSIVFVPSGNDCHQDHTTVYQESIRALKHTTILGYELPWNLFTFNNDIFVHLSEQNVQNKINACLSYQSQTHRPYCNSEYIKSQAITRGVQANTKYAEVFELIRMHFY